MLFLEGLICIVVGLLVCPGKRQTIQYDCYQYYTNANFNCQSYAQPVERNEKVIAETFGANK